MPKGLALILLLILSCQPLPRDIPLEKYRRQFVEGQVFLHESLRQKMPEGERFLTISVRDPENPMPLAMLRIKNPTFPYHFRITGRHKLNHDRLMEGEVIISARLSSLNSAEPQKGDLTGTTTARVGTRGVRIVIDSEVK